jgi:cysteine desulfurase/selenocysteine lyase
MTPLLDTAKIRPNFPILARRVHDKPLVYLDSAATGQKPQQMIERLADLYRNHCARPEEGHALSKESTEIFETARGTVASLIHARSAREVVFTRGATGALNLLAISHSRLLQPGDEILLTVLEHHSNIAPWVLAARQTGARVRAVPVDRRGDIDMARLPDMLGERVKLVAVTHFSHVTGGVQDVAQVVRLAHARGIPVLVDGAQAVPHMPVDVREIGCDYYVGSGHKMGGPMSVGFLWGKAERLEALPMAYAGSTMAKRVDFEEVVPASIPLKFEAGEPSYPEVAAWEPAIHYWQEVGLDRIAAHTADLAAHAAMRLSAIPRVRVLGDPARRVGIVTFIVEGMPAAKVAAELDREGIAVRAGKLAAEPLLKAFGVDAAVRAVFQLYNDRSEADFLADVVTQIAA